MRTLGRTGLLVSQLGLGCATFGREISEAEAFAVMDHALANGITVFDTAEAYGGGQARAGRRKLGIDDVREVSGEMHSSEKIVGRWLKSRGARAQVTLVTKVSQAFQRDHVRAALEASLERLQTDQVDLYLYHAFDPASSFDEANLALDSVIKSGLARAGGCSNYAAAHLAAALASAKVLGAAPFGATEVVHNLLQSRPDVLQLAQREHLGVLGYSPLAAGFLSGKYSPDRAAIPKGTRFDIMPGHANVYFTDRNFERVAQLRAAAARLGLDPLQLALAWACHHPAVTTLLVGARHVGHLDQALAAAQLELPAEFLTEVAAWNALPVSVS